MKKCTGEFSEGNLDAKLPIFPILLYRRRCLEHERCFKEFVVRKTTDVIFAARKAREISPLTLSAGVQLPECAPSPRNAGRYNKFTFPHIMKDKYIDEPLIVPLTPAEALARVTRVLGALTRDGQSTAIAEKDTISLLQKAQLELTTSFTSDQISAISGALALAQSALSTLHAQLRKDDARLQALGFPTAVQLEDPHSLAAPDEKRVVATYTLNDKQVLTSLAFEHAPGATAYWLHVVRYWEENGQTQRIEDPILESPGPFFARVRLPVGPQILRLKSRNPSASKISEEFSIHVPDLNGL
jgi:hypothetical protein